MTLQQTQKIEEIKETLETLQKYVNERLDLHNDWSGKGYTNDMFKNIDDMIFDLYDHDTYDIMDGGLNCIDTDMIIGD